MINDVLRIARVRSTEQSGIQSCKIVFDYSIVDLEINSNEENPIYTGHIMCGAVLVDSGTADYILKRYRGIHIAVGTDEHAYGRIYRIYLPRPY